MSTTPQAPQAPPQAREPILGLLQKFAKTPGCGRYSADSKKIELITTYLWLRQLTEGLTFEVFLAKFAALADYNAENRKHPEDALKHHCPHTKKAAAEANVAQWNAKERVEILSVYVDMVREAERQGVEVPLTLDAYLEMDGPNYKAGNVAVDRPAKKAGRHAAAATGPSPADPQTGLTSTDTPLRPTVANQRIIYEPPGHGGRQIKGTTRSVFSAEVGGESRTYVAFITDEGERFDGVSVLHCTVVDEPPSAQRADVTETKKIWIPKAQYPSIMQALALTAPMANVAADAVIYPFTVRLDCGLSIDVNVLNGETGPFVEAQLYEPANDNLLQVLPPRQNILGEYRFEIAERGVVVVEVCTRD